MTVLLGMVAIRTVVVSVIIVDVQGPRHPPRVGRDSTPHPAVMPCTAAAVRRDTSSVGDEEVPTGHSLPTEMERPRPSSLLRHSSPNDRDAGWHVRLHYDVENRPVDRYSLWLL